MANYLTSIDVLYPFIPASDLNELLDDDGDGTADTAIFTALAAFVESQFHGYVVRRYQIPLDTTDATILAAAQMYCSRLFEYAAFSRRRLTNPEMQSRYAGVIKELEGIRDGKVGFNDPPTLEASVVGGEYTAEDGDRDYTASKLQYYGGSGSRS